MLQQRAERKAIERSAKRNRWIRDLNKESCLVAAHLQPLEEQLEAKMYIHQEPKPEAGEEQQSTLCTHLALHKALWAKRPTAAQRISLLERAENKTLCPNNSKDFKSPDVPSLDWPSGNDTDCSQRVPRRKGPTTDAVIDFGKAAFSIATIDDEIGNLDKHEEPMGIQHKVAKWTTYEYDPCL